MGHANSLANCPKKNCSTVQVLVSATPLGQDYGPRVGSNGLHASFTFLCCPKALSPDWCLGCIFNVFIQIPGPLTLTTTLLPLNGALNHNA